MLRRILILLLRFWISTKELAKAYPYQFSVSLAIVILHISLLFFMQEGKQIQKIKMSKPRAMVVQTIKLQPPKSSPTIKKESSKQSTKPKPKPIKKKNEKKDLFKSIKESLTKIKKQDKSLKSITAPQLIGELHIDKPVVFDPSDDNAVEYQDEIVLLLTSYLRLPEHGKVKVKLTIQRTGSVSKLEILNSDSKQNKKYVEHAVSEIVFPDFGDNFKGQQSHDFLITLASRS